MVTVEMLQKRLEKFNVEVLEETYFGMNEKVTAVCPKHGQFTIAASNLVRRGCPHCGNARSGQWRKIGRVEFISRAEKKFGKKFDYSLVDIHGMNDEIEIICPEHGSFRTTPEAFLGSSQGCPKCGTEEKRRKMIELWKDPEFYQKTMLGIAESSSEESALLIRLEAEMGKEWADGFRAGLHWHESWPYKLPKYEELSVRGQDGYLVGRKINAAKKKKRRHMKDD